MRVANTHRSCGQHILSIALYGQLWPNTMSSVYLLPPTVSHHPSASPGRGTITRWPPARATPCSPPPERSTSAAPASAPRWSPRSLPRNYWHNPTSPAAQPPAPWLACVWDSSEFESITAHVVFYHTVHIVKYNIVAFKSSTYGSCTSTVRSKIHRRDLEIPLRGVFCPAQCTAESLADRLSR
jgi:hypothetical protein